MKVTSDVLSELEHHLGDLGVLVAKAKDQEHIGLFDQARRTLFEAGSRRVILKVLKLLEQLPENPKRSS